MIEAAVGGLIAVAVASAVVSISAITAKIKYGIINLLKSLMANSFVDNSYFRKKPATKKNKGICHEYIKLPKGDEI